MNLKIRISGERELLGDVTANKLIEKLSSSNRDDINEGLQYLNELDTFNFKLAFQSYKEIHALISFDSDVIAAFKSLSSKHQVG